MGSSEEKVTASGRSRRLGNHGSLHKDDEKGEPVVTRKRKSSLSSSSSQKGTKTPPVSTYNVRMDDYWRHEFDSGPMNIETSSTNKMEESGSETKWAIVFDDDNTETKLTPNSDSKRSKLASRIQAKEEIDTDEDVEQGSEAMDKEKTIGSTRGGLAPQVSAPGAHPQAGPGLDSDLDDDMPHFGAETSGSTYTTAITSVLQAAAANDDGDTLVEAERVDAETVVYAKNIQRDNFKRRIILSIVFALVLSVTLTTIFLVLWRTNQKRKQQSQCTFADEVCCVNFDEQPLPKSIPLLCYCNQSLAPVEAQTTETGIHFADHFQDYAISQKLEDFNPSTVNETTCGLYNQMYLALAIEEEQPVNDLHNVPPIIFDSTFVLSEMYIQMEGFRWLNNHGWFEEVDICAWFGVDCLFVDTLSGLSLPLNGLQGQIPTHLGRLTTLRTLDLSSNAGIVGSIPSQLGDLNALNTLDLSDLNFNGTILPSTLGQLNRLGHLKVSNSSLSGPIPREFYNLESVRDLYLSQNDLTGSISSGISKLSQLMILKLNKNQLSGTLPSDLASISTLEVLDLSHNQFSGTFPAKIATMPRLSLISIADAGFEGVLPDFFCNTTFYREVILRCSGMNWTVATAPSCVRCFENLPTILDDAVI